MDNPQILALRMQRQHLTAPAGESEYNALYRDLQPGLNVYWNGFGDPPGLTYRAAFDDIAYNRGRQSARQLLKLRLAGGNLGWVAAEDLELFAALYQKPLDRANRNHLEILSLIERGEPMNIQQMKEETGLLVKAITPALHRLQEAFLLYEDQFDGDWDRGWYPFSQMFPEADLKRYSRHEALKIVLARFAYRLVWFDGAMAKAYFKLPKKEVDAALADMAAQKTLLPEGKGWLLAEDAGVPEGKLEEPKSVFALHKNDFLYKAHEHLLKPAYLREGVETLYYLLIDGRFLGAAYGKFRYGPPDFPDLRVDLPKAEAKARKKEILAAVSRISYGKMPEKYNGESL